MQLTPNLRLFLWSGLLLASSLATNAQAPNVTVVEMADNLSSAIGLASADDGSGRLFIVQQSGQVLVWNGALVLATTFLDLNGLISQGPEQGLLGLAFHPDFATNGFFYVDFTDLSGDTVVARYSVSAGDPNVADPLSELVVITIPQPAANHNGGDAHFGPDGRFYFGSGDGGGYVCDAEEPKVLLGSILRIGVDGDDFPSDPDANYIIPADNPFVGVLGARDEIWIQGLRNPWRFSFDRLTGDLWIGDVGEGTLEEIDFLPAGTGGGENLGWPWFEGTATFTSDCLNPPGAPFADCGDGPFTCPVLTLDHADGNQAIIGGYRYRGEAYPALRGFYFYTDWAEGTLWAAEPSWTPYPVASLGSGFTGFGEDENGELYIVGGNRLVRIIDPTTVFANGFQSGSTSAWTATVP